MSNSNQGNASETRGSASKLTTQVTPGCAAKAWGVAERCAGRVAAAAQLEPCKLEPPP